MTKWERDIALAFRQAEQRSAVMHGTPVPSATIDKWITAAERDCAAQLEAGRALYRRTRDHALAALSQRRAEYEALRAPVACDAGGYCADDACELAARQE